MANFLKFEYHPDAIIEANAAFHWYHQQSEQAAENFWQELVHARQQIVANPELWGKYLFDTRCFRLYRYPYGLVYIPQKEKIIGLAVVHFKRRPGYWKERLNSPDKD